MHHRTTLLATLLILAIAPTASAAHWSTVLRTFLLGETAAAAEGGGVDDLDPLGRRCMSCHDGSRSHRITLRRAGTHLDTAAFQTRNHPVGMRYDRFALTDPRHFRSRATLPPRMALPEGRVSCPSCHLVEENRSGEAVSRPSGCLTTGDLTVDSRHDNLCRTCHLL